MKNAAVAGLIAGIIGGIVALIVGIFTGGSDVTSAAFTNLASIHIGNNAIWGIIFGLIFSAFYSRIPGKGISKGFYFGLLLWLLVAIRPATFLGLFGEMPWAKGFIIVGFFFTVVYGIVLGALYKK